MLTSYPIKYMHLDAIKADIQFKIKLYEHFPSCVLINQGNSSNKKEVCSQTLYGYQRCYSLFMQEFLNFPFIY